VLGLSECRPVLQLKDHFIIISGLDCEDIHGVHVRVGEVVVDT